MTHCARVLLLVLASLGAACGTGGEHTTHADEHAAPAPGTATIVGTCLDGDTLEPLAGVEVVGPGGVEARTDDRGRFVLAGLAEGASGEVVATARDGRRASNPLQPLGNVRLEVVMHLR